MAVNEHSNREYIRQYSGRLCGGKILAALARAITSADDCPPLPQWPAEIRHIPGCAGYAIGADGTVWSCRPYAKANRTADWRQLRPYKHPQGDLHVSIGRHRPKVARLVALTFIGPRPPKMDICHSDGNKLNNAISNLRWDTRAGNVRDAIRHGTFYFAGLPGEGNRNAKLTDDDVRNIRRHHDIPDTELSKQYGVTASCIGMVRKRKTWKHVL